MPRISVSLALLGLLAPVGCAEPAGPGRTPLTEAAMAPARDPALRPVLVFDQEQVALLSSNPTGATQETTCSIIRAPGGDLYEGGKGFQNQPGFPDSYWVPLFLSPDEDNDLPFRTLVRR